MTMAGEGMMLKVIFAVATFCGQSLASVMKLAKLMSVLRLERNAVDVSCMGGTLTCSSVHYLVGEIA